MAHCHPGIGHFLAVHELRSREVNVVGLPLERRQAGVDPRGRDRIDAATLVMPPVQAKAVENLHLVTTLDIDAAVPAALTAIEWLIGEAEFDVPEGVAEGLLAGYPLHQQAIVRESPVHEGVGLVNGARSINDHHSPLRRLLAQRRADPLLLGESDHFATALVEDHDRPSSDLPVAGRPSPIHPFDLHRSFATALSPRALAPKLFRRHPAITRQPAGIGHNVKRSLTQGNDLGTDDERLAVCLDRAEVLALQGKIVISLRWIGEGRMATLGRDRVSVREDAHQHRSAEQSADAHGGTRSREERMHHPASRLRDTFAAALPRN